jgi:hypothetical protein
MCLLDFCITEILTSTTVIIECISWLIKVTGNNDARLKPEIKQFIFRKRLKGKVHHPSQPLLCVISLHGG